MTNDLPAIAALVSLGPIIAKTHGKPDPHPAAQMSVLGVVIGIGLALERGVDGYAALAFWRPDIVSANDRSPETHGIANVRAQFVRPDMAILPKQVGELIEPGSFGVSQRVSQQFLTIDVHPQQMFGPTLMLEIFAIRSEIRRGMPQLCTTIASQATGSQAAHPAQP